MIRTIRDLFRSPKQPNGIRASGRYDWAVLDTDYSLLRKGIVKNAAVTVGLNDALSVLFAAGAQHTAWAIGLINGPSPTLAPGDTMLSHVGWTENQAYDEATRGTWTVTAPSGGSITNTTTADFTASSSQTFGGIFTTTSNTKGGTTGILWATGAFGAAQSLSVGQVLQVQYTVTFTPVG